MPTEEIYLPDAYAVVIKYALAKGDKNLNERPGLVYYRFGDEWELWANPHREIYKTPLGVNVDPFTFYVEFNGFPAGVLAPNGGWIAAGDLANEDSFIEAVKAETPID